MDERDFLRLLEPDRVPPPFVVDKAKYDAYEETLGSLEELKRKGILDYNAHAITEEFDTHVINITWIPDENGDVGFEGTESMEVMAKIFANFFDFATDTSDPLKWTFTINIYHAKI